MVGIDLFAGAGGMSLGARAAGVDVALAVELDRNAASTYAVNHPRTSLLQQDIRAVNASHVKTLRNASTSVLFGGPPCQGFSYSNQRTRGRKNPDNWLFREFLRVAALAEPDWVVFENVKGIVDTEGGAFLDQVLEQLSDLGYVVAWGILNAADFGAPQKRERFFAVGNRVGVRYGLPKPRTKRAPTVRDAIADLPRLTNGANNSCLPYRKPACSTYARKLRGRRQSSLNNVVTDNAPYVIERYAHIPQGGNWQDIPPRLMRNYRDRHRCHTGIYYRLKYDEPSIVIGNFRKNMLIHPTQDRGLSVREAARLQSFPDSYQFMGSIGFQQQQVGNAVPPVLAQAVFESIALGV
jgi:DNA (cytosine-5)-methyltransferase 1